MIPLLFSLGAAGTGALAAGLKGVGSARAAAAQDRAANRALDQQRDIFNQQQANFSQSRQDMAPWLDAGRTSLGDLMRQMQAGGFDTPYTQFDASQLGNDPGYQFRMAEGQKALERSAAARGGLNSGGFMKGLSRYSQGLASDEFGNAWNRHQAEYATRQGENANRFGRLSSLAGMGQNAGQYMGSLGQQFAGTQSHYADAMSDIYGQQGNARAAGARAPFDAAAGGIQAFNDSLYRGLGMMSGMGGGMGGMGGGGFGGMIPSQGGGASTGYAGGYIPQQGFGLNYGGR